MKSNVVPFDLKDKSTWRNIPCPVDLSAIQRELTKLGGTIDGFGRFHGEPHYKIVWAQEWDKWLNGKKRPAFDEVNIDPQITINHYAVSPECYVRLVHAQNEWSKQRRSVFKRLSKYHSLWSVDSYFNASKFLANESSLEYRRLDPDLKDKALALHIPKDWRYVAGHRTVTEIAQQAFYVLQWMPPQYYGDKKAWDVERFDRAYVPELDEEDVMIDILGEFPVHGGYDHVVVRVANKVSDDFFNYKEPTVDYVMDRVRELHGIREKLTEKQRSVQARAAARISNFHETAKANIAGSDFNDRWDDALVVGKGNPTNISSNKNKDL